ncbi:hypothetical protein R5R35_013843 [Gryllus longicercus]|uniref:ubiquitinyl hydrolase 1 n=1 Tax=Gryllus longicercus TaxID=2509291 RepID=A0AAN9VES0_9ORTH
MDQDTSEINACSSSTSSDTSLEPVHLSILTDPIPLDESFDNIDENALSGGSVRLQSIESESEQEIEMGIENTWMDEDSLSAAPAADFPIPLPPPGGFDDIACLEPVAPVEHGPFPETELSALFTPENDIQGDVKDVSSVAGVCGLRNLGNTCFMGAGLQCLAATPSLVQYFLSRHVGEKEPSHSLTAQFAALIHKMWSGQFSIVHPSEFKEALGLSQPQFKDFRQHDCQEFLALLLDSLHEQLNSASCKSILSEGSTAEPQSPCEADEKESLQKGIIESLDQELTLQTTASLDSLKCNQSSSSRSSESSGECHNCFRLQSIPENVVSFKESLNEKDDMDVDSGENDKCFKSHEEKQDVSVTYGQASSATFSNNSLSPNSSKKDLKINGEPVLEKNLVADRLNSVTQCFRGLQDILKDAKTSNVNVLVTEQEANNEIRFDSEKFPKHENLRRRDPLENPNLTEFHNFDSKTVCVKRIKETNLLHESMDHAAECDKCFNNIKRIKLEDQEKNFRMECERKLRCLDSESTPDNAYREEAGASSFTPVHLNEEIEADKHWENHLALNQSIVVDSFQGQFKSTVVCSSCKHVSVTYEPFMYLSVPLPHAMERQICVTFVPAVSNNAVKYLVTLNKQDKVKNLKDQVISRMGESGPKNIALAEVLDSHIARILDDNLLLRYVNDTNRSIYAFELLPPPGNVSSDVENVTRKRTPRTRRHLSQCTKPLDLTPNLNGGGKLNGSSLNSGHGKDPPSFMEPIMEEDESEVASSVPSPSEQGDGWKSCAICLEEMDLDLRRHTACSCVLCEPCIETSCRHHGGAELACPVCGMVVNPETEFVPLNKIGDYKPTIRLLNVPIVFRMDTDGDGNNNKKTMRLFGHPNLVRLPNRLCGQDLYQAVDRLVPYKAPYSILFVDGQGYHCSRCMYTMHCRGCRVASKGEVMLQTGDTLAVRLTESVDEKSNSVEHSSMRDLRCRDPLSLYDCLQAFSESEQLDEHNPWYCPVCQKNQCATKTLSVWRYPDFLIVYLKRFVFHDCVSLKLENKVTFPLSGLSVTPASILQHDSALPYNLYACVCHFGGSAAGHYTAYSKNPQTNEWHYYNDESVTKQRPQEEDYCNAYILFYQKQGKTN